MIDRKQVETKGSAGRKAWTAKDCGKVAAPFQLGRESQEQLIGQTGEHELPVERAAAFAKQRVNV